MLFSISIELPEFLRWNTLSEDAPAESVLVCLWRAEAAADHPKSDRLGGDVVRPALGGPGLQAAPLKNHGRHGMDPIRMSPCRAPVLDAPVRCEYPVNHAA